MTAHIGVYDHWDVEHDDDDIVWLALDRQGESTNTLSKAVIRELGEIISVLESTPPAGVVISSAKDGSFIVGADIREFDHYDKACDVSAMITQGHAVFARLENLPSHTVATVHGFCLGGGLELALSCNYIIALNVPATRVGNLSRLRWNYAVN
jgi:3-hydroxyacyl-CoA dehydrogenase/enoyl-CoA hydratase/3-hydroxybutyryl-CoA epimerase